MALTDDSFKPRQFKDGDAYEVFPKIFLGALVRNNYIELIIRPYTLKV